jgi:hypothetical protein
MGAIAIRGDDGRPAKLNRSIPRWRGLHVVASGSAPAPGGNEHLGDLPAHGSTVLCVRIGHLPAVLPACRSANKAQKHTRVSSAMLDPSGLPDAQVMNSCLPSFRAMWLQMHVASTKKITHVIWTYGCMQTMLELIMLQRLLPAGFFKVVRAGTYCGTTSRSL